MDASSGSDFAKQVISELIRLANAPDPLREVTIEPVAAWTTGAWMYFVYRTDESSLTFGIVKDTSRPDKLSPWRSAADAAGWYLLSDIYGVPYSLHTGDPDRIIWLLGQLDDELPRRVAEAEARNEL